MELYHITRTLGIQILEPKTVRNVHTVERKDLPCVCAAPSPEACAALCTHLDGEVHIYKIHPDDVCKFQKVSVSWDSDQEFRAYEKIRVQYIEKRKLNYTRPCTCGSGIPWNECGWNDYCG